MRYPRNAKIFRGQLDVAPFAGVFFCLLIFLLLSSSLVSTTGVKIDLAQADELSGSADPSIVIAVDAEGRYYLGNRTFGEAELRERLRGAVLAAAQQGEKLVLVALLDEKVTGQKLVRLAELARGAGVGRLVQATRPRFQPSAGPEELP
ncbi:MAG: biopolymer transporter ExbD [Verrucomicrobiae bacterium]|jgi:biopolymer transport protein ExbD|nr:biopolymer transporter ExbD [Verrucomicrobiae bacterium]